MQRIDRAAHLHKFNGARSAVEIQTGILALLQARAGVLFVALGKRARR